MPEDRSDVSESEKEREIVEAVKKISPKRAKRLARHRKQIEKMLTGE